MLRAGQSVLRATTTWRLAQRTKASAAKGSVSSSVTPDETAEQFDKRFVDFFNRADIDGFEIRMAMTDLGNHDVIPEPDVTTAALHACRRVNDSALALRFLELIRIKSGPNPTVYNYVIQEVKPVLKELGLPTLEEIGYDKPELFIPEPEIYWQHDWYEKYGYGKHGDKYTF